MADQCPSSKNVVFCVLNEEDMLGVDIRVCADEAVRPYFNEGTDILLEHSLPELQNSRVLCTSVENKFDHNYGFAGDCWSEVHHMIKRPLAFISKNETDRVLKKENVTTRRSKL